MVSPSPDSSLPSSPPVKQVLVVHRSRLIELFKVDEEDSFKDLPYGMLDCRDKTMSNEESVASIFSHSFFTPRAPAETNPELKQIIPYVVIVDRQGNVLSYTRGKAGQEDRLHALQSIGFGGHIDLEDRDEKLMCQIEQNEKMPDIVKNQVINFRAFQQGINRELEEELDINSSPMPDGKPFALRSGCLGVINNDLDEVGSVHIGVLFVIEVAETESIVGDHREGIENLQWIPLEMLAAASPTTFEAWSAIALPHVVTFITEMQKMKRLVDIIEGARLETFKTNQLVEFFGKLGAVLHGCKNVFEKLNDVTSETSEQIKILIEQIEEIVNDDRGILDSLCEARDADFDSVAGGVAPPVVDACPGPGGVAGRAAPAADDGVSYPQVEDDLDEPLPQRQGGCDGETCESCQ